ncbi:glutathione peroxidase [Brumimicrobium oceani]|uniref:Glutathione peroxidase n=1 Tax=Brumimicrobium oceani TaxID=2100725 RepID=A0A2U2XH73_9FLAO|nr:glutathione peroxidase [Brumimicrobium oceani]PWH87123.1 glutathione peroxidase [Brumimicrobium oceani]
MKTITLTLLLAVTSLLFAQNKTIYDYEVETIDGEMISLSVFKGKKVMIVNTASKCGYTSQYEQLQELYETYGGDDFVILGFPSNDFLKQEPGSDQEIAAFCQKNYGVTFPMMSKISVKNEDMAPLYGYLTSKEMNGKMDSDVKWNFQKYLIGANGQVEQVYYSKTLPTDAAIIEWIKN